MERLERADQPGMMGPRRPDPQCKRNVRVTILIPCASNHECNALLSALKPDDETAPKWLKIREEIRGSMLQVVIEAPITRIMSARQTSDEILEYSYSLLRTLERISAGGSDEIRSPSRAGEE
jgi:hypothetical protein